MSSHPTDPRALLIAHPSMRRIADELLSALSTRLRASDVSWQHFPDGWPNVRFEHRTLMKNRDVVFLASFHDPALVLEQASLMVAVARQSVKSLRIFVPWFGPGTMERVNDDPHQRTQELATAETVLKMVTSCLPCTAGGGPPSITIFDIHALVERFYANDRALIILDSALPLIKAKIIAEKMTVIFPDEGAFKRFGSIFKDVCSMVVCSKVRGEGDTRVIAITQEFFIKDDKVDPMVQHAILIDDLVQSGNTLGECAAEIRAKYKFQSLSAYVTHAVFPRESYKQFLPDGKRAGVLDHFYVTDTNPTVSDVLAKVGAPFQVLSIVPLLVKSLSEDLKEKPLAFCVTLCSMSPVKKRAVELALQGYHYRIRTVAADSRVPKQPIGPTDIKAGALNRLRATFNTYAISIESGLCQVSGPGDWQEMTYIAIRKSANEEYVTKWVVGPYLSDERYKPLIARVLEAKGEITLGELLHAQDPTIPADEWYPRAELIAAALKKLLL